jgi:hypothetical protein
LTSSNGVTTTDSVAPAKHPVAMASICVFFFWPLLVKKAPHQPLAPTRRQRTGRRDEETRSWLYEQFE